MSAASSAVSENKLTSVYVLMVTMLRDGKYLFCFVNKLHPTIGVR